MMVDLLCDKWGIAERVVNPSPDSPGEIKWTCDLNRVLFLDESACRDRKEKARVSRVLRTRLTRSKNRKFSRRSFAQLLKGYSFLEVIEPMVDL